MDPLFHVRQGDVLLERIDAIPSEAVAVPRHGPIVLAEGKATGHTHHVRAKSARLFETAGRRFLKVGRGAVLEHQEHDAISLPAGAYRVVPQVEYTPAEIRQVAD